MFEIKNSFLIKIAGVGILLHSVNQVYSQKIEPQKPNIIYILADDLGYGDLGCYGQQKIETPNIDLLAKQGIMFTRHYSGSAVCAPSRCSLLTGKHSGHAQIRGNDEWTQRGDVWNYRAVLADSTLEGQIPLAENTITLAHLLKNTGYSTGLVGKWGLGAPNSKSTPNDMGFDFFFGYNCQRQAHTYYPVHLYKNRQRVFLGNDTLFPHTKSPPFADSLDPASYGMFNLQSYSPDVMFVELTNFVQKNSNHPFFLFWATPIPHLPLQAPQRWVDYYVKKFGDESPYTGRDGYFPVRYPHATYAAMISYFDEQVGILIDQLKKLGLYENTLIIVTSDNGPSYTAGIDSPWFASGGPFRCEYGYGKGFLNEGGIRIPMIAAWPGKIKPGRTTDYISAFWDVLPTLCDVAGVKTPIDADGLSFLPELMGDKQKKHRYLYWEFPEYGGQQAVMFGKWKVLRKNMHQGNTSWEIYNLKTDPYETRKLAKNPSRIIKKTEKILALEHEKPTNEKWWFKVLNDK